MTSPPLNAGFIPTARWEFSGLTPMMNAVRSLPITATPSALSPTSRERYSADWISTIPSMSLSTNSPCRSIIPRRKHCRIGARRSSIVRLKKSPRLSGGANRKTSSPSSVRLRRWRRLFRKERSTLMITTTTVTQMMICRFRRKI